jgi:hypothetical protein
MGLMAPGWIGGSCRLTCGNDDVKLQLHREVGPDVAHVVVAGVPKLSKCSWMCELSPLWQY